MKRFACTSVDEGCGGVVTGATEDDVLAAAARHAAEAHGMTDLPPEVLQAVRAGITDTSPPPPPR